MKMLRVLFLTGSMLFLLCACGNQSEPPAPAADPPAAAPEQASAPQQPESAPAQSVIEGDDLSEESTVIHDPDDGLPLLTVRITRPDVSGLVEGSTKKAIDRYYDNLYQSENDWWSSGLADFAKENKKAAADYGGEFLPFSIIENFQIVYSGKSFLSIRRDLETYTGGAHGAHAVYCENFRTADGSLATLPELFRTEDYKEVLLAQIVSEINQNPEKYELYEDWETMLETGFDETSFFVGEEDLAIVYQEYEIAPYSEGALCFNIPYADISNDLSESFLNDIYGGKE